MIIRDPESSEDDFHRLAEEAGLQDISYFIGWTALLDLAPKGVSKARGLALVARGLGEDEKAVVRGELRVGGFAGGLPRRGEEIGPEDQGPQKPRDPAERRLGHGTAQGPALEGDAGQNE